MTQPVVAVRGEAFREVDPEIASFVVTVVAHDRDRNEALRRLSSRVDSVRAALDGYRDAVEKRETSGLFVYPETKGSGERVVGYHGNVTTSVTVTDFAVLGELMLHLAGQDQTSVAGPWWALRPGSPVHREARREAIADALERAREYAAALGARVVGLIELADSGLGGQPVARHEGIQLMAARAGAAPGEVPQLDLEPRRQEVRAYVEARVRISEPTLD
jgi:uncharacterized protein YggE